MIDHNQVNKTYVAEILQSKIFCGKCIYLKTCIDEVIQNVFIKRNLSAVSDMALYQAQYKHT